MNDTTKTLPLDSQSIDPTTLSMPTLMREIELQVRPNWILSKLMNALEKKRQAKGLGWSRSWNKYGLNVFRTHKHTLKEDPNYFAPIIPFIKQSIEKAPSVYRNFANDLFSDPSCMAFSFYHNNSIDGDQHEGLTISFGRKVPNDRSKRDRLDIVIEDQRMNGGVDGLVDRVRIYVCPWNCYDENRQFFELRLNEIEPQEQQRIQSIYDNCLVFYHQWKNDESRQWAHWSARFIDYFGPRSFIPRGTSFS